MKSVNETNQMWRDVKDEQRKYKQNNRDLFLSILDEIKDSHEVIQLTEYQYRIDGKLDIYPSNRKWHVLATGKRGQYRNISDIRRQLV
jgi:hypothetical protein